MKIIKRYRFFITGVVILVLLFLLNNKIGIKATLITVSSIKEMILVIPPIFILLGLLDVWIKKETMIKYMGENSGRKGILLSIFIGSAAAGPLYGAFPVAVIFMKKGVKFSNIIIFLGAWSTTKIPMFLFEMAALGRKFALSRLLIDICGIIIISKIMNKIISKDEVKKIYQEAEKF